MRTQQQRDLVVAEAGQVSAQPASLVSRPSRPHGANQGSRTLTRARTDAQAVAGWLSKYGDGSPHTLAAYRREGERLLLWLATQDLTLAKMTVEDVLAYQVHLRDPQPRARWCLEQEPQQLPDGSRNPAWAAARREPRYLADGQSNPAWRPFVGPLGDAAARQALTVLYGLLEHLCAIGYLAANPFRAARRRVPAPPATIERYLEHDALDQLLAHVCSMPAGTQMEQAQRARALFVVRLLYLTGLRRAELVALEWADVQHRRGQWWLVIDGKGGKTGQVPLNGSAVAALNDYRAALSMPPLQPGQTDAGPVLRDVHGARGVTVKALHQLLTRITRSCPDVRVQRATAHWLRHSAASHMLDAGVPLQVVRDNLRHASISTTSRYVHADSDRRHRDTERHRL
jgi:site-specific recombinase XerD